MHELAGVHAWKATLRPRAFRAFTKINPRPIPRLIPRPAAQFRVAAFAAPRYAGGESALNLQRAIILTVE